MGFRRLAPNGGLSPRLMAHRTTLQQRVRATGVDDLARRLMRMRVRGWLEKKDSVLQLRCYRLAAVAHPPRSATA